MITLLKEEQKYGRRHINKREYVYGEHDWDQECGNKVENNKIKNMDTNENSMLE